MTPEEKKQKAALKRAAILEKDPTYYLRALHRHRKKMHDLAFKNNH